MQFVTPSRSGLFGGNSGIIPRPGIMFGAYSVVNSYDYIKEQRPLLFNQAKVAEILAPYNSPEKIGAASVAAINATIGKLQEAILYLQQYEKDQTAYYDARVNRTSGGKRTRLRNERSDLRTEISTAINNASTGIRSLETARNAKAALGLEDGATTVTQDPSGQYVVVKQTSLKPRAEETPTSNLPGWLIPVGAAAVAFLALKS